MQVWGTCGDLQVYVVYTAEPCFQDHHCVNKKKEWTRISKAHHHDIIGTHYAELQTVISDLHPEFLLQYINKILKKENSNVIIKLFQRKHAVWLKL